MARHTYTIKYLIGGMYSDEYNIDVVAGSKAEAYAKATFEAIPAERGEMPFASWVAGVTYGNGNHKTFNTMAGKPY